MARRRVVLEESVRRNVIAGCSRRARRAPLAARGSIRVCYREVKPAHERPPTYTGRVEQIANILSLHAYYRAARAYVTNRVRIVYYRERSGSSVDHCEGGGRGGNVNCSVSLARNKVQQTRSGRAKAGAIGIVAHGEMLRVVPQSCDRVAIKVGKVQTCRAADASARWWRTGLPYEQREQIHNSVVEGLLFCLVAVALVPCDGLRTIQPKRISGAGAVRRIQVRIVS